MVDFARRSQLLKPTSGRNKVATSPEDDKLAKRETSCLPEDALEIPRLPRAAQLPPVAGLPLVEAPTSIPNVISFAPEDWLSTPLLRRQSEPFPSRTKFLIAIAVVAALPAGYFIFGNSDRPVDSAVAPQAITHIPPSETLLLREGEAALATTAGISVESKAELDVQATLPEPPPRLDKRPTASANEATSPLSDRGSLAASQDVSTCFPSASAVRQNHPGGWPSWTLRAPGHEGTKCWYAATRTTTRDHRSEMRRKETAQTNETVRTKEAAQTIEKPEVPLFGLQ
jgi:hypothetical protein